MSIREHFAIVIFVIMLLGCVQSPAEERILSMNSRSEILLPPDSDGLAWRYDMKMIDWAGSCAGLVYDLFTQAQIDRRADELKAAGINTVIINGLHMHHCFLDEWPKVTRDVAMITAAAHKRGMKVIFHHDVPVLEYNGKGFHVLLQHLDWLQRDIEYDRPTLRCFCFINPDFRASYFDRMETFARATGIDGVMLDEIFFEKEFCGCEHCRRAFTAQTGLVLPRNHASKTFYNKRDPLWIAWLEWRKRAVGDWWVAIRKRFNTINRDFCIMTYTTHGGLCFSGELDIASDITECARGCDFIGTEIMARNVFDCWRAVFAFRKVKTALGDHFGIPIFGLVYHLDEPTFAYAGWAMNHMNRQTSWMAMIEGENMGRYMDWPLRMQSRFARPVSDVAVLFSFQARDFGAMYGNAPDAMGISQCLTDAHIQHDFILDNDLADMDKLSAYKLLILPSSGNLSDRQAEAVRKFARAGGRILASAHTSLLDEHGFQRNNFALADVFGADYVARNAGPENVSMRAGGRTIVTNLWPLRVKARAGAEITADMVDEKGKAVYPAIVSNAFGRGQCIYAAFPPGAQNCERELSVNEQKDYEKNGELSDLLLALVRQAAGVPFDVEAIAVPQEVALSVCRQNDAAGKRSILLHLLNMTGANLKKGETIPVKPDWTKRGGPFPAIAQDIIIDIRCKEKCKEKITRAYIVSPDYENERPVEVKAGDGDVVRVTVRKDDLKAYSIVYLELDNAGK